LRAWLGHASLDTTHIYAEVDLAMKEKAFALGDLPSYAGMKAWHSAPKLMEFLRMP
jgi:integrase/recombinase XerD